MQKEELRQLLNQPYKTDTWKQITDFVFPNVSYLQKPQDIPIPTRFQKISDSFKQMGNVRLNDGKNLAIFEVHVADNVNISSNRVQLRELVAGLIDQERNHGVLVIYEQGKEDYRFTFTAKSTEFDEEASEFVNLETDAKRYTYILGKNESCRTAVNRFWELKDKKDSATIKDVEQAFSVERLNKDFFNRYKEFYESFVQYITGKRFVKEKGKWVEKTIDTPNALHKKVFKSEDKLARNFVKLLLGRIVFIQFLQKKGWMGVPASSKKWENGDKDFIYTLFKNCKDKSSFHSKSLFPLFYEAFNTAGRANDIFPLTNSRVPYLNGGLFENEYPESHKIDFPEKMFEELLEFFSQYNFTIDENDPFDHEVGIDPEMLGHIFENLLEDNKDKGAFYTPKPIVQYMCQESLKEYLCTYLKENKQWPTDKVKAEKLDADIQNFVRKKEAAEIINYDEHLAKALMFVKVCDPAIGSGAFPMGILNEIYYCIQVLHNASPETVEHVWQMNEWRPDIVKKNIIQHSIYGVDIEKGAVDIARLRFWLSLIVDEKAPYPLPNLDFKIMQGNSLLESYEGIDLSNIGGTKKEVSNVELNLFGEPKNKQSSIFDTTYIEDTNISELIVEYFNAQNPERKQELKKIIDEIIHRHIDFNLEIAEKKIQVKIDDLELRLSLIKISKSDPKAVYEKNVKSKEKLEKALEKEKAALKNLKTKRKELHDLQNKTERPYFLWHLFFKDVLDEGGFDIVIGNPPYLRVQGLRDTDSSLVDELNKSYMSANGSFDLYVVFLEKGLSLINTGGVVNYIMPVKWTNAAFGTGIRKVVTENNYAHKIINFGSHQVFNASTYTGLQWFKKDSSEMTYFELNKDIPSTNELSKYLYSLSPSVGAIIPSQKLNQDCWILSIGKTTEILDKLNRHERKLSDVFDKIFQGLATSKDDVYFLYECKEDGNLITGLSKHLNQTIRIEKDFTKPLLKGEDVHRYQPIKTDRVVIFPYKLNEDSAQLYEESEIKRAFPLAYSYLKKCESALRDREKGRLKNDNFWYRYIYPKNLNLFKHEKLVAPEISLGGNFSYDENGGFYSTTKIYGYIKNEGVKEGYKFWLGLLNSSIFWFFIRQTGYVLRGGYFTFKTNYVHPFPIPKIIPSEITLEVENLVSEILEMKKNSLDHDSKSKESAINNWIYKLYDLKPDEISIIEGDEL